jgi:hypothetical protein
MKRSKRLAAGLALSLALALASYAALAQDDWAVIQRSTSGGRPDADVLAPPAQRTPSTQSRPSQSGHDQTLYACGEAARPPSAKVKSIIDRINGLWNSDIQVYQAVAAEGPHAMAGGCVFYNTAVMASLVSMRLDVNDPNVVEPLLWAIFAHEVGHEVHRDFASSRSAVPVETKELEADRFAGYTLQKLKIRATDLAPYWTLTGDEFGSGPGYKHGSSAQRVAAFKQGWHLAEWNRPEESQAVQSALDESVAPEESDAAPK